MACRCVASRVKAEQIRTAEPDEAIKALASIDPDEVGLTPKHRSKLRKLAAKKHGRNSVNRLIVVLPKRGQDKVSTEGDEPSEKQKGPIEHDRQAQPLNPPIAATSTGSSARSIADKKEWWTQQRDLFERQIEAAKCLNRITAVTAAVTLIGLLILGGTLIATKESDSGFAGTRAWLTL